MTNIPPNIIGSIAQAQIAAKEAAKKNDAQRNKRAQDSRELARTADQFQHEVTTTDHAENLRVNRQDQRQRDGQDAKDTYEHHAESQEQSQSQQQIYSPKQEQDKKQPPDDDNTENNNTTSHIDLSA